ncbi:uncharacterized protein LOC141641515 [Silene latifolia]|uniref:uncharacterized protein LOC141641515 n=1 Tax=Silene latifolia TaxID=37657 RepID=UPI003D780E1E
MPDSSTEVNSEYRNPYDDPLFLSNSDFPRMSLVNPPFNGKNLLNWSRGVVMGLGTKNKQGFIDGSTAMPELTSPRFQSWKRSDYMVRCWILHSLTQEIKEIFMNPKSAKCLWSELNEMYGQSNAPLLYRLKKDLRNIDQSDKTVVEYYNKLKRHWDDIEDLEPIPDCTCGALTKCSCSFLKRLLEITSREKVLTFLMGLDDLYDNLKTNILSMDPLPKINKAYSLVQQIESQKSIAKTIATQVESSAMAVHKGKFSGPWNKPNWNVWTREGNNQGSGQRSAFGQGHNSVQNQTSNQGSHQNKKGKRWCDHCNKSGQLGIQTLLVLSFIQSKESNIKQDFLVKETFLEVLLIMLKSSQMRQVKIILSRVIILLLECTMLVIMQGWIMEVDARLVAAIYQQMVHMKQKGVMNSEYSAVNFAGTSFVTNAYTNLQTCFKTWIVDSGATDHMSSAINLFQNKRNLSKPIVVGLPDGTYKRVTIIGDIILSQDLILHKVLYIADFKHNLLSVGKLLSSTNLSINFDIDRCIIQDHHSKATVAVGLREEGLYKLKFQRDLVGNGMQHNSLQVSLCSCKHNKGCTSKIDLFHARLGHTSLSKLKHLDFVQCADVQKLECETCVLAKMHKLPYNRSQSYALNAFDLIHIDLWGPYKKPTLTGATYFLTILDDHTRVTWTFLLKDKYQVSEVVKDFLTQFGKVVK